MKVLVTGAGGFIGGHLMRNLEDTGHEVTAVDCKPLDEWHQIPVTATAAVLDLNDYWACLHACDDQEHVYHLAADMGGMGFIETHKADCMQSVIPNTNMLRAARDRAVDRFFFSSSACVYAADKQVDPHVTALREADAYPAMPEDGYGWEKLFTERMCRHFTEDYGLHTRVARYHNVYGPHGTYVGGREKAPAAICRKVCAALLSGQNTIEIWGDGEQTRSFMFIDDCVFGTRSLMVSDADQPVNIGSSELVTINQLVDLVESFAGVTLNRVYKTDAPQGVRGRNSDNTLLRHYLDWEPSISLVDGLARTFEWIYHEMTNPSF